MITEETHQRLRGSALRERMLRILGHPLRQPQIPLPDIRAGDRVRCVDDSDQEPAIEGNPDQPVVKGQIYTVLSVDNYGGGTVRFALKGHPPRNLFLPRRFQRI